METQTAWDTIKKQELWLKTLLRKTAIPPGVSRADLLSEMRIVLFEAFRNSFDPAKSPPPTFASRVYFRRIERVLRRLTPASCERLTTDQAAPEHDERLEAIHELRQSNSLNEIERFALGHLERYGRLGWSDIRARFPGEFAFDNASELARKRKTYVAELLAGIREKL